MGVLGTLLATGCTVVHINSGEVVTSSRFGVLEIRPAAGARLVAIKTRGLGIVPGLNGTTIGYSDEDVALVYDENDCRVVILELPEDKIERERLMAAILGKNICVAGGTENASKETVGRGGGDRIGKLRSH